MYIFTVNAVDAFGNKKQVEIKSETVDGAIKILKDEGFRASLKDVAGVRKDSWWSKLKNIDLSSHFSQVPKKSILHLIKMLGSSLKRGRTLKESLEFIGENEDNRATKAAKNRNQD